MSEERPITIIRVAPIGSSSSLGFVNRSDGTGGIADIPDLIYPDSYKEAGRLLRSYRLGELGFMLGEAAHVLGIQVHEYSSLEHGRMTADMTEVRRRLKAAWQKLQEQKAPK